MSTRRLDALVEKYRGPGGLKLALQEGPLALRLVPRLLELGASPSERIEGKTPLAWAVLE
jgi:hypothetical protein